MLEGLNKRYAQLDVPCPELAVVDNCCTVRNHLVAAMPDLCVVLDVFHFQKRSVADGVPFKTLLLTFESQTAGILGWS